MGKGHGLFQAGRQVAAAARNQAAEVDLHSQAGHIQAKRVSNQNWEV